MSVRVNNEMKDFARQFAAEQGLEFKEAEVEELVERIMLEINGEEFVAGYDRLGRVVVTGDYHRYTSDKAYWIKRDGSDINVAHYVALHLIAMDLQFSGSIVNAALKAITLEQKSYWVTELMAKNVTTVEGEATWQR
jgi:hypothetical protein